MAKWLAGSVIQPQRAVSGGSAGALDSPVCRFKAFAERYFPERRDSRRAAESPCRRVSTIWTVAYQAGPGSNKLRFAAGQRAVLASLILVRSLRSSLALPGGHDPPARIARWGLREELKSGELIDLTPGLYFGAGVSNLGTVLP